MSDFKIRDLRDGMRRVDVTGAIMALSEPRTVNLRTGGEAKVADATIQDDSGQCKLTLWDDQIDQVKEGAVVAIKNGYTNSYQGEMKLNVGKYGSLAVVS